MDLERGPLTPERATFQPVAVRLPGDAATIAALTRIATHCKRDM
jgi:hypothetical protein